MTHSSPEKRKRVYGRNDIRSFLTAASNKKARPNADNTPTNPTDNNKESYNSCIEDDISSREGTSSYNGNNVSIEATQSKAVPNSILEYLQDRKLSLTWRPLTTQEGLTASTYSEASLQSHNVVPAACLHCNEIVRKRADKLFSRGCGSTKCRSRRPRNKRMRRRVEMVAKNKGDCYTLRGDVVERQVTAMLRTFPGVIGAACMGSFNGTWDVVAQMFIDSVIAFGGVQVKLAAINRKHPRYQFGGFNTSYPELLPLIAGVADTGLWLVASCGQLRNLRVGNGRSYYFNVQKDTFRPFLYDTEEAARDELMALLLCSQPLTRETVLADMTDKVALDPWSFEVVQSQLRPSGEFMYRNNTSSDGVGRSVKADNAYTTEGDISAQW